MLFFYLFAILSFREISANDREPIAITSLGSVRGSIMKSANNREFYSFRSIPYAKPPIKELRFQDPVETEPWTGILDGTRESPACVQFQTTLDTVIGKEDCLYLNVYTHHIGETERKRPVVVWIHGGAFFMGSGNGETDMYGPGLLLDRDIVLVTLNYRLGPLGFLSTDDHVAPGNFGLLDQEMALRWVKRNIEAFGGDLESITIFGESAGGASVEFQVLSQRSKGLFHRAISQSGSAVCSWAVSDSVKFYTLKLAEHLNCPNTTSHELVECLREKDAYAISNIRKEFKTYGFFPVAFGPRVDKERSKPFIESHPKTLLQQGNFNHVPFIAGVTKNEGACVIAMMMGGKTNALKEFEENVPENVPVLLDMVLTDNAKEKSLQVWNQYFDSGELPSANLARFEELLSDYLFFSCCHESILLHAKYNREPTYAYWYTHHGERSFAKFLAGLDLGVSHADELFLMFTSPMFGTIKGEDDKKASKILLDFWTSFAVNGVPSSADSKTQWLPTTQDEKYMDLSATPAFVEGNLPFAKRVSIMNAILNDADQTNSEKFKSEL